MDLGIKLFKASGNNPEIGNYLGDVMAKLEEGAAGLTVPPKEEGKVGCHRHTPVAAVGERETERARARKMQTTGYHWRDPISVAPDCRIAALEWRVQRLGRGAVLFVVDVVDDDGPVAVCHRSMPLHFVVMCNNRV